MLAVTHSVRLAVGVSDDPEAKNLAGIEDDSHKLHTLTGNQPLYSHDRCVYSYMHDCVHVRVHVRATSFLSACASLSCVLVLFRFML